MVAPRRRRAPSRRSAPVVLVLALAVAVAACGAPIVHRPLAVEIQGLSRLAQSLELMAFPKSARVGCEAVDASSVKTLAAPISARWTRGDPERALALPEVDEDELTLVVFTEDAGGRVLQVACTVVSYAEIEEGLISLRLPPATARIIRPWRRPSDPSSWSGSSVAEGWPRCSSPPGGTIPRRTRWS